MAFTYFFRDLQTLDLVEKHVLPALRGHRFIDIWDAGCATGHEPYSLAIILRENMGKFLFRNVRVYATDIDNSNLFEDIIKEGIYPYEQLKRIPAFLREKYFSPTNGSNKALRIRKDIRRAISYGKHDLLSLKPIRHNFGLIVCKNVLLHFQKKQRVEVIKMFHAALTPGGYLITEQTQKMPAQVEHLFEMVLPNAQIHRRLEVV